MSMLDFAINATIEYIDHMPKSQRKKYGQFFTSKETAVFMAELFKIPNERQTLSILDPGAGSGILSIALLERLQAFSAIKEIRLVCYENDPNVMELLRANLEVACSQSRQKISYEIVSDNYILSQATDYNLMLGANLEPEKFDFVIGNPPYMKIAKDAPEALSMPDVCYGAPKRDLKCLTSPGKAAKCHVLLCFACHGGTC
ncbi:MAG: N-6 DNA methylase [Candidatus Scatomorpha sp.]|jgi:adenine-specific DNA-methyltransferase